MLVSRALGVYRNAFSGLHRDIWLLSVVMFINRSGAMVLPFLTIYATDELHFTLSQAGWLLSWFGVGSMLGSWLGGKLTDSFDYYTIMFWSLLGSGVILLVMAFVNTYWLLCLLIALNSAVADMFRPANFVAVARHSKPENRTRAIALLRLAINLGFGVGPALGGIIAAKMGFVYIFWIDGITCILAGFFLLLFLQRKEVASRQLALAETASLTPDTQKPYTDTKFLLFSALVMLNAIAFFQLFSTWPVYLKKEIGLAEDTVGYILAINGFLIATIEMPLIYVFEKRYRRTPVIVSGALLVGLAYAVFGFFGGSITLAVVSVILVTFGEIFTLPFFTSMAMEFTNDQNRGRYMGFFSMVYAVAHILSPYLGTQTAARFGFPVLWFGVLGVSILTAIGFRWRFGR